MVHGIRFLHHLLACCPTAVITLTPHAIIKLSEQILCLLLSKIKA